MAHLSSFPDPSEPGGTAGPTGGRRNDNSQFSFTELKRLLGQHGAGSRSEDLALDLMLHEIASEACSVTRADGAAIALWQDEEFVCRAASGNHTPDLGSRLAADSGLSGACIQSRALQRCDDTEADPRVDAAACRRLGVRSVVVVPMLRDGGMVGILEAFSPHTHAFTDRDTQTLLTLSRRMLDKMTDSAGKEPAVDSTLVPGSDDVAGAPRDPWMPVLTVLLVALAVILGWMIGYRGWRSAHPAGLGPVAAKSKLPPAESAILPVSTVPPQPDSSRDLITERTRIQEPVSGGLAVYEKGKLIFQEKPRSTGPQTVPVRISSSAAESLILERVEPQYPRQARLAQIQGPVVLEVSVNEKGGVDDLRAVSGDPGLADAASEAVRQWRFKPYAPRGNALPFQTQITVDFKLP
jgi:TonB family protein